jgi:hypothetical protein
MKARELKLDPTAFQCTICLEGEDDVPDEPNLFDQLVKFQEDTNSVIFAHFPEGSQYLVEVCDEGHVLCVHCAYHLYQESNHPNCPQCRSDLLYPFTARTLPVFNRTAAEKQIAAEVHAMVLVKNTLAQRYSALMASQPPTPQETLGLANVQAKLDANRLLPAVFDRQRCTLALHGENRLLHNFVNDVFQAPSYYQILLHQAALTGLARVDMQTLAAEFDSSSVTTEYTQPQGAMHLKMQFDLCEKKIRKTKRALPFPDYKDRLNDRDPQWLQRTRRHHNLPPPTY